MSDAGRGSSGYVPPMPPYPATPPQPTTATPPWPSASSGPQGGGPGGTGSGGFGASGFGPGNSGQPRGEQPEPRKPRRGRIVLGLSLAMVLAVAISGVFLMSRLFSSGPAEEENVIADLHQRPATGWTVNFGDSSADRQRISVLDAGGNRALVIGYAHYENSSDSHTALRWSRDHDAEITLIDADEGELLWQVSALAELPGYTGGEVDVYLAESANAALFRWFEIDDSGSDLNVTGHYATLDLDSGEVLSSRTVDEDTGYHVAINESQVILTIGSSLEQAKPVAESWNVRDLHEQLWNASVYVERSSGPDEVLETPEHGTVLRIRATETADSSTDYVTLSAATGEVVQGFDSDVETSYRILEDGLFESRLIHNRDQYELMLLSGDLRSQWHRPLTVDSYSVVNEVLYTFESEGASNRALMRIDPNSGDDFWERVVSLPEGNLRIGADEERLYYAVSGGDLLVIDADTGAHLHTLSTADRVTETFWGQDNLYVLAGDELSAHDLKSGADQWRWNLDDGSLSSEGRESLVRVGDYLLVLNSSRGTLTVLE